MQIVDGSDRLAARLVDHLGARREVVRVHGSLGRLAGEVQHGHLQRGLGLRITLVETVHQHEHPGVGDLGDVDLGRGGDAVPPAQFEHLTEPRREGLGVVELRGEGPVERAGAWHPRRRSGRLGGHVEQVVCAALDPPGVSGCDEVGDLVGRHGEHPGEIPARQGEHARLPRVVRAQQQVRVADRGHVGFGDVVEAREAARRGDEGGRRARDAVLREDPVVVRGARETLGELRPHEFGEVAAGDLGPAEAVLIVGVPGRPVHQLVGELVVVLQSVHELHRLHAELERRREREAQELGLPGREGMVVPGATDEVVGQVGTDRTGVADVLHGQVQLLEGETADLANHPADDVVRRVRERMPLRPRRESLRALLHAEEAVGVQAQRRRPQLAERVEGVADHQAHAGERGVEPVDRGLPLLEVVQVDPPPGDAVRAGDGCGRAPVGLLHARRVEDDALQGADDVPALGELVLGRGVEVDAVDAVGHVGQEPPVLRLDLDHVVDPGVILVPHLGEAEVGALAGVTGNDVVDDAAAVAFCRIAQRTELVIRSEGGVDLRADAVEVTVDARGVDPSRNAARALDRTGVDRRDADALEGRPQLLLAEGGQERLPRTGDERDRIRREPHVGRRDRAPRIRSRVGVAPHRRLPRHLACEHIGVVEHRLVHEPLDVARVGAVRGSRIRRPAPHAAATQLVARTQPPRTGRITLLVVRDLRRVDLGLRLGELAQPRQIDGTGVQLLGPVLVSRHASNLRRIRRGNEESTPWRGRGMGRRVARARASPVHNSSRSTG